MKIFALLSVLLFGWVFKMQFEVGGVKVGVKMSGFGSKDACNFARGQYLNRFWAERMQLVMSECRYEEKA